MRGGWVERGTVLIRLTRPHFAFYRGVLERLALGPLARRYLETAVGTEDAGIDGRLAASAVSWIRSQLLVAAHRSASPTTARLLSVAPERLQVTYAPDVPSLESFREERDPYEVYPEEELIRFFTEQYGDGSARATRLANRNARLRNKQLIALWQLEELVAADPKLTDGVDGWLDPALATRLKAANLLTVSDLINAINGAGYRWYMKVPKIGEKAAAQIVRWLTEPGVSAALGIKLHARGVIPMQQLPATVLSVSEPRTDIVPLENFLMPSGLDGTRGTNRGERSLLSAHNDLAAIEAWLSKCKPGGHTRRSYRKEAERFVLWAIIEKNEAVSSLTVEDCIDYRDWLWNLGRVTPAEWAKKFTVEQARWLGQRGMPRWSSFWRPFKGPLTDSSQKTALVIIQGLCQWLTDQHYLHGNPFKSVGKLARTENRIDVTRALTNDEWKAIKLHLSHMQPDARYYRLRFILVLAYSTGARLSELVGMRKKDLKSFNRDDDNAQQWEIRVTGKGGVTREVQLHLFVMNEIRQYFKQRGHASFDEAPPETPLIAGLEVDVDSETANQPLSASRLYDILKKFFTDVANSLPLSQREMADRMRKASTHWLRHTFATHFLHTGGELAILRDLLGHKSLSTTSVYVTTERDNRSRAMEKFGKNSVL